MTPFIFIAYKMNLARGFNYQLLVYDFDATSFQNFKKKIGILVIFVPFEILSHYPYIDSSHWRREDVQWIIDKVFRETLMVSMSSILSCTFLLNFWFLHKFVDLFIIIRLVVMSR